MIGAKITISILIILLSAYIGNIKASKLKNR